MKTLHFRISGLTPLLMHRPRLADPLDPITKEFKPLSAKRRKTDDDYAKIADIEWESSLYTDEDDRLIVPGDALLACIRDGGKTRKLGSKIQESCTVDGNPLLIYEGPKSLAQLKKDPNHRLRRFLKVQRQGVMRVWPRFKVWALEFDLLYPEEAIDAEDLIDCTTIAGRIKGLLESRTRGFGRFKVEEATEAA